MNPEPGANDVGARIREFRQDRHLTLSQLAKDSGISKGYLWNLENAETSTRPSAETLYAIAEALGVTMADLFGRRLEIDYQSEIPDSLREFAEERDLPEADVKMLASIHFRGEQPRSRDSWAFIYDAIRRSTHVD